MPIATDRFGRSAAVAEHRPRLVAISKGVQPVDEMLPIAKKSCAS
jgi:hypothetical protein